MFSLCMIPKEKMELKIGLPTCCSFVDSLSRKEDISWPGNGGTYL